MLGKLYETASYSAEVFSSAVSAVSPYLWGAAKALTQVLAVQSTLQSNSKSPYESAADSTGLVTYNFSGLAAPSSSLIPPVIIESPVPVTKSHLRGSFEGFVTGRNEGSKESTQHSSAQARQLSWQQCSPAAGYGVGIELPDSATYLQNQSFPINIDTLQFNGQSYLLTMTFSLITSQAVLEYNGTTGPVITAKTTGSPIKVNCIPDPYYNGGIIISMSAWFWHPSIGQCTIPQNFGVVIKNTFDQLKFPTSFSKVAAYVNSPILWPIPAPSNEDRVTITYSLAGSNLTSDWATVIQGASDGTGAYVSLSPLPGFQAEARNLTIIANGANPPNPPVGNYSAYQANMTLQVTTPSRGPAVIGSISCPAGTVGSNVTCTIDPTQVFGGPDGYDSISKIVLEGQPNGVTYNEGTLIVPVDKKSPNPIRFDLVAEDVVRLQARASVSIATSPSLTYTVPADALSIDESTSLSSPTFLVLPAHDISTPSPSDTTVTYSLGSTLMGRFSCNSANVTSAYNPVTGTLTLTGSPDALNDAEVRYYPSLYYSGPFSYYVTIKDGGLNLDAGPFSLSGNVNFVYVPLSTGTALQNATLIMGQTNTFTLPDNAVSNPHRLTLGYEARMADGSELPDIMQFDSATGALSITPQPGDQGNYAVVIRAFDSNDPDNHVDLNRGFSLPNHAPIVNSPLGSKALPRGVDFRLELPATTFSDPDGADIAEITASGLPDGATYNHPILSWTPGPDAPSSVEVVFTARDTQNQTASTTLNLSIQSSLSVTSPAAQTLAENTGSNIPQNITLPAIDSPSTYNGTITYSLNDASAGDFVVDAVPGVSIEKEVWKVELSGPFQTIKNIPIRFIPTLYRRVGVGITVTVKDGLNDKDPKSTTLQLGIAADYVPLSINAPLNGVTISIGQVTQLNVPSSAFNNFHSVPVSYSLVAGSGTVPAWMAIDSRTGTVSFNPAAGNQGTYQNLSVRVQGADRPDNYVDLPLDLTVAQHAPIVANPISPQSTSKGVNFLYELPVTTFSDPDGNDIVEITASGLPDGATYNHPILSWTPGPDAPSSAQVVFTARDTQNQTASTTLNLSIQSSLSVTSPAAQTLAENTGSDEAQSITPPVIDSPSTYNGTITYTLNDASAGRFVMDAVPGVSIQNQGEQVVLSGPFQTIKNIPIRFIPTLYRRVGVGITVTVKDGLNNKDLKSTTLQLGIAADYVPLSINTPLNGVTISIGQVTQLNVPSSAFNNFHSVPVSYSLVAGSGTVPAWMTIDSKTGTVSFNPAAGNQGTYQNLSIRVQGADRPDNYLDLPLDLTVAQHRPTVANPLPPQTIALGEKLVVTVPGDTFQDPDGPDDMGNVTASGLQEGMSFDGNIFTYEPKKGAPAKTRVHFTVKDTQDATATTTMEIETASSLSLTAPAQQILAENTGSDAYQNITLPAISSLSTYNGSITYSLNDVSAGKFVVDAVPGVSIENENWKLVLSGPFQTIKNLPIRFIPSPYRVIGVGAVAVTVDDGLNDLKSTTLQLGIAAGYVPLSINAPLNGVTISIGQATQLNVPSSAFNNFHNVPVSYSLVAGSGTVPAWMTIDSKTGTVSFNPAAGNQGTYQNLSVRVQGADRPNNFVDLPLNIVVPERVPVVANPLSSQTAYLGIPFSYQFPPNNFTFSDPDGPEDLVDDTVGDLPNGATYNPPILSWKPGADAPSSVEVTRTVRDTQGATATARMTINVEGTLQTYAVNNVVSVSENAQGVNATLNLMQVSWKGGQNATVTINMPSGVGSFVDLAEFAARTGKVFSGVSSDISVQNGYATCVLTGTQDALNLALQSLPVSLTTNFNGLGNPLVVTVDNGIEKKGLPLVLNINPIHHKPVAADIIPPISITVNEPFSIQLPSTAFTEVHVQDVSTFSWAVTMADGSDLPSWLHFDPATRTLSGKAPSEFSGSLKFTITDASTDPTVSLADRQASQIVSFASHAKPILSILDDPVAGKIIGIASGLGGSALLTFLTIILPRYNHLQHVHAEQRKTKAMTGLMQRAYSASPNLFKSLKPAAVFDLLQEIKMLNESGPPEGTSYAQAFQKLANFKAVCTAFCFANQQAARRGEDYIVVSDRWKLLDLVEESAKNLTASILNPYSRLDFVEFRLRYIRCVLDFILLTDSAENRPILIDTKVRLTYLLQDLVNALKERKPNPAETAQLLRIKYELKGSLACLSCLVDNDTTWKSIKARRRPLLPRAWYLKVMQIERLLPYALAGYHDAYDQILKIYSNKELTSWKVIEAGTAALRQILASPLYVLERANISNAIAKREQEAAQQLQSWLLCCRARKKVKRSETAIRGQADMYWYTKAQSGSLAESGDSSLAAAGTLATANGSRSTVVLQKVNLDEPAGATEAQAGKPLPATAIRTTRISIRAIVAAAQAASAAPERAALTLRPVQVRTAGATQDGSDQSSTASDSSRTGGSPPRGATFGSDGAYVMNNPLLEQRAGQAPSP